MIKNKGIILILGAVLISTLFGCKKEDVVLTDPQKYTRPLNLALPIFQAKIKAVDLIENLDTTQFIFIDEDSLIHVQIDTAFSAGYEDVIEFDEMALDISHTIAGSKAIEIPFYFADTLPAALIEGQRFDYTTIKTAQMEVKVSAPSGFTGSFKLKFPEIIQKNGDTLIFESDFGQEYNDTRNLEGATLSFFQNASDISSFRIVTEGLADSQGGSSNGALLVSVKMVDFVPNEIFGFFGKMLIIEQKQDMDFDFLGDYDFTDMIDFKDVKLTLGLESYFGIPISLFIDSMLFSNSTTGETVLLKDEIRVGEATYGPPLVPSKDYVDLDLVDAINIGPDNIYYEVNAWANFEGEVLPNGDTVQNFLINDGLGEIEADILIDIPFWFKISNYERTDIIDFDIRDMIEDETTIDYLEELILYFDFNNGFPFSIQAQAYAVNATGDTIENLFDDDQYLWKSPAIDVNGKAVGMENNPVDLSLTYEKVKSMYDNGVKFLHIQTNVSSGGASGTPEIPEFVKLYTSYNLEIKLSVDITGKASTK